MDTKRRALDEIAVPQRTADEKREQEIERQRDEQPTRTLRMTPH